MNLAMNRASQRNKARRKMDDYIKSGNTGHSVIKGSKAKGINDIHVFSDGTNAVAYQKNKLGKNEMILANYKNKHEIQTTNNYGTTTWGRTIISDRRSLSKFGVGSGGAKSSFYKLIDKSDKVMKTSTKIHGRGSKTVRSKIGSSGG